MQCKHLSSYSHGSNRWAVSSCIAKTAPYVPSVSELEHFCRGARHAICPAYRVTVDTEALERGCDLLAMAHAG